jgi:hypothetical protein
MSGPIIRVGATPQFSKGWDEIFGKKKKGSKNNKKAKSRASRKGAKKA